MKKITIRMPKGGRIDVNKQVGGPVFPNAEIIYTAPEIIIEGDVTVSGTTAPQPKPFDLEAANAGEPIECFAHGKWHPATFVSQDPRPVKTVARFVAHCAEHGFDSYAVTNLRMAPKPKRYANLYEGGMRDWRTYATEQEARDAAKNRAVGVLVVAVAIPIDA